MNVLLPSRFSERFERLLLGIQPMDALREQRIAHRVEVMVEGAPMVDPLTAEQVRWLRARIDAGLPLDLRWPRAQRHASSRYVIDYAGVNVTWLDVRIIDRSERFVPRRLRVPLTTLGTPPDVRVLDALVPAMRSRFPALFPGAAYDVSDRVTGLRGRVVVSDGGTPATLVPVRWPRIAVRTPAGGAPIAWAHGDQHGEFLLILPPESIAAPAVQLPKTLTLTITAHGRRGLPGVVPPPLVRRADPWWDLPLETLDIPGTPADADPVALGRTVPNDYDGAVTRSVPFVYSRIISSDVLPFDIT